MSWFCKQCETVNPDDVLECEVCSSDSPYLEQFDYNKDLIQPTMITLKWRVKHSDSVVLTYSDYEIDVTRQYETKIIVDGDTDIIFKLYSNIADREFKYTVRVYYTLDDVVEQASSLQTIEGGVVDVLRIKRHIQESMQKHITDLERFALLHNILPDTLVEKVKTSGKDYLLQSSKTSQSIFCIAMAVGTVLKELENGNVEFVSNQSIVNIMNELLFVNSQMTLLQLYTGFLGLEEIKILTHPLGRYLDRIGLNNMLDNNMSSACFMISQSQYFLFIIEDGVIVGQHTVWPEQNIHYSQLKRTAIAIMPSYEGEGFYINHNTNRRVAIMKKNDIGEPAAIVASVY